MNRDGPAMGEGTAGATLPITAIVLTYNEAPNLDDCLSSLAGWVDELFVVDSGSEDETLEIAARYGAVAVHHPFESHARQWGWALDRLPASHDWCLGLDADQRVTPELRDELFRLFEETDRTVDVAGYFIKRRQVFRGKWIRFGGYYPKYLLKLFRRSRVRVDEGDLLDHHFYVDGPTGLLRHDLVERNRKEDDIGFWVEKHSRYARVLAQEERQRRSGLAGRALRPRLSGNPDERTAWLKERWYRLPLYLRPALYFLYRYVLRLGFLDGKEGFVFHFLQGYWFRLLVDIHLDSLRRGGGPAAAEGSAPGAVRHRSCNQDSPSSD